MKKLVLFYLIFAISIYLGLHIEKDPGYVLIAFGQWTVEMPLWFFIIAFLTTCILTYLIFRFFANVSSVHHRFKHFLAHRQSKKAHKKTQQGLIAYSQGNWTQAEKLLLNSLKDGDMPLINYLTAARAAEKQNKIQQRDKYLRIAKKQIPEQKLAILLTQAELQLENKQYEQALATLQHLQSIAPHHRYVMKLMLTLSQTLNDWQLQSKLLPELRKLKLLNHEELLELEKSIFQNQILNAANHKNQPGELLQIWRLLPKYLQKDPQIIALYASKLIQHQEQTQAETLLRQSLKKTWHSPLIKLYAELANIEPKAKLDFLESLLKLHPNSATLLLHIGRLAMQNQLWGKSKTYLNQSLSIRPQPEIYLNLGELYQALGDEVQAEKHFHQGLLLSTEEP